MSTVTGPLQDKFLQPIDRPEVMDECPDLVLVEKQKADPVVEDKFAVIQIRSHQFKVTSDDKIYLERVNGVDVNDHIFLKKVLVWASKDETVVGRPYIKEAYVHALVEEQCEDKTIMVFKKKRRKGYRRLNYHTQVSYHHDVGYD